MVLEVLEVLEFGTQNVCGPSSKYQFLNVVEKHFPDCSDTTELQFNHKRWFSTNYLIFICIYVVVVEMWPVLQSCKN